VSSSDVGSAVVIDECHGLRLRDCCNNGGNEEESTCGLTIEVRLEIRRERDRTIRVR
jgi:hypothetical protein